MPALISKIDLLGYITFITTMVLMFSLICGRTGKKKESGEKNATIYQIPESVSEITMDVPDEPENLTATPSGKRTKLTAYQHYLRGLQLKGLGEYDKAVLELESAIEMNPKFPKAYVNLARIYLKQDKPEEASLLCEAAIKLDRDCADAHYVKNLAQSDESVKPENYFLVL